MKAQSDIEVIPGYGYRALLDECKARDLPVTLSRAAAGWEMAVWTQRPPRALDNYKRAKRLPPAGLLVAVEHFADLSELDEVANLCRRSATSHGLLPPVLARFDLDDLCDCGCARWEHSPGDGHCFHHHSCGCRGLR